MNRFKVRHGQEQEFERIWRERDSYLPGAPGFIVFRLLRGAFADDHTLYSSHGLSESRESFEAWAHSEAFQAAHRNAGAHRHMYLENPKFEDFEVVQRAGSEAITSHGTV